MDHKLSRLKSLINEMESVIVAYSGGVDSTFLLKVAHDCLGDQALAVTAVSASLAASEQVEAEAIARRIGAAFEIIESKETEDTNYLANTPNRCYFCKSEVYKNLVEYARQTGHKYVVDGTNADDVGDHRPGRQAARELGVRSPLLEVGLAKAEIRELAHHMGLSNWDKPAAACLASRIPYGTQITIKMLSQVEQAEEVLREIGLRQLRVRLHDQIARIEVEPGDFQVILDRRQELLDAFKTIGFTYITLDLAGFRSGSMNETLKTHGP